MAGGWGSVTDEQGRYCGAGTMDTGGDVEEFAEQVFGMVTWLAHKLAGATGSTVEACISDAGDHWREGLRMGGRSDGAED